MISPAVPVATFGLPSRSTAGSTKVGPSGLIGRITPSGLIAEFPIPGAKSRPWGIAAGPDGDLWFTDPGKGKIGRITPGLLGVGIADASGLVKNELDKLKDRARLLGRSAPPDLPRDASVGVPTAIVALLQGSRIRHSPLQDALQEDRADGFGCTSPSGAFSCSTS